MHISISPSKLTPYNVFKQHTKLFHRQDTYFFLQHSNVKNLEREWPDNVIEQVQAIASIPSKPLAVLEFRFDLTTKSAAYNWTIDKKYGSLFNAIDTQDGTTMELVSQFRPFHILGEKLATIRFGKTYLQESSPTLTTLSPRFRIYIES